MFLFLRLFFLFFGLRQTFRGFLTIFFGPIQEVPEGSFFIVAGLVLVVISLTTGDTKKPNEENLH